MTASIATARHAVGFVAEHMADLAFKLADKGMPLDEALVVARVSLLRSMEINRPTMYAKVVHALQVLERAGIDPAA